MKLAAIMMGVIGVVSLILVPVLIKIYKKKGKKLPPGSSIRDLGKDWWISTILYCFFSFLILLRSDVSYHVRFSMFIGLGFPIVLSLILGWKRGLLYGLLISFLYNLISYFITRDLYIPSISLGISASFVAAYAVIVIAIPMVFRRVKLWKK